MIALIKQMNIFLFGSQATDLNGMAVVMKIYDMLYFLSVELHTNSFEIVPVQLIARETNSERKARFCKARQSKKQKRVEENDHNRQIRLQKDREYKKRKRSQEIDSDKQNRPQKVKECKKRKQSEETDSQQQIRLEKNKSKKKKESNHKKLTVRKQPQIEKDRLYQKQKCAQRVLQPQCEIISQQDY